MTDYWVSRERHCERAALSPPPPPAPLHARARSHTHTLDRADCKFCKCWLQGDSVSIKHHEGGKRHKEMVEASRSRARAVAFSLPAPA